MSNLKFKKTLIICLDAQSFHPVEDNVNRKNSIYLSGIEHRVHKTRKQIIIRCRIRFQFGTILQNVAYDSIQFSTNVQNVYPFCWKATYEQVQGMR
jgi:hypothetical protein